jgi:hypothetical protein
LYSASIHLHQNHLRSRQGGTIGFIHVVNIPTDVKGLQVDKTPEGLELHAGLYVAGQHFIFYWAKQASLHLTHDQFTQPPDTTTTANKETRLGASQINQPPPR